MRIAVPREVHPNERRVATTPEVVEKLIALGFQISVETQAGDAASFSDQSFEAAGATIVSDSESLWQNADIVMKVRAPEHHPQLNRHEADLLHEGQTLISFIWPAQNAELMDQLAAKNVTELRILRVLPGEDAAAIHFEMQTPKGPVECCDWVVVKDGRITEIRSFYDATGLR